LYVIRGVGVACCLKIARSQTVILMSRFATVNQSWVRVRRSFVVAYRRAVVAPEIVVIVAEERYTCCFVAVAVY
jgi:hypothetical protein